MTIFYKLQRCILPSGDKKYRARVNYNQVYTLDDLLDLMDYRISGVSRAMLLAVFAEFFAILVQLLRDGNKVVTPFGIFGLKITGYFQDEQARLDRQSNTLEVIIKASDSLQKKVVARAEIRKKPAITPEPDLQEFTNLAQPDSEYILTPGHMARLRGHHLKFDSDDPQQGIFLRPVQNDSRSLPAGPSVRIEQVGQNTSRQLIFLVPTDLPVGLYVLEVKALFGTASLRTGQLKELLIVP